MLNFLKSTPRKTGNKTIISLTSKVFFCVRLTEKVINKKVFNKDKMVILNILLLIMYLFLVKTSVSISALDQRMTLKVDLKCFNADETNISNTTTLYNQTEKTDY
jgi:hypothetical protein